VKSITNKIIFFIAFFMLLNNIPKKLLWVHFTNIKNSEAV
jgi:hypothetical protein